jgi:nucleoside-diphosphate-sugar epimerase
VRVLVTGGNRYIGLHLVRELVRRGHDVTVVNSHEADLPEGVRRIHGDRQQPGVLTEVLTRHRDDFDVVFDNTAYEVKDVEPMVELFSGRIAQYVFTSSVAVYKRSFVQPVRETSRTHDAGDDDPRKAYGVGKVRSEQHLFDLHERTGFPATSLRVSHTIGPLSPLPTREPNFFARLEQGRPILIPGDGFPFVNVVHVHDVATLMASLVGNDTSIGQIYNVSGPEYTSILGSVRLMAKAVGVEPEVVHVPLDVARGMHPPLVHWGEALVGGAVFAIDKALRDLDWTPQFGLESGYQDSYDWFRSGGRERYTFDFSRDDELLARLGR